jgi:hypothetical protein
MPSLIVLAHGSNTSEPVRTRTLKWHRKPKPILVSFAGFNWRRLFMRVLCETIWVRSFPGRLWTTLEACFGTYGTMFPEEESLSLALRFTGEPNSKDKEASQSFRHMLPTFTNLEILRTSHFAHISYLITEDRTCCLRHICWVGLQDDLNEVLRFQSNLLNLEVLELRVRMGMDLRTGKTTMINHFASQNPEKSLSPAFAH